MRALPSPLLVVTDRHGHPRPLVETVRGVLDGGARWIWFRDRDFPSGAERRAHAVGIAAVVGEAGGVLSIGADPDLAAGIGAAGVHLGGGSGRGAIAQARSVLGTSGLIGVSAHTLDDVKRAADERADYATLSPVFESASKPGYGPALGLEAIAEAARIGLPVIALGGIDARRVEACRRAGAAGFAIMGGLMRTDDPVTATRGLLAPWLGHPASYPPAALS